MCYWATLCRPVRTLKYALVVNDQSYTEYSRHEASGNNYLIPVHGGSISISTIISVATVIHQLSGGGSLSEIKKCYVRWSALVCNNTVNN